MAPRLLPSDWPTLSVVRDYLNGRTIPADFSLYLSQFKETFERERTQTVKRFMLLAIAESFREFRSLLTKPDHKVWVVWITEQFGETKGVYPKQFREIWKKEQSKAKMDYIKFFLQGPLCTDVARHIASLAVA